MNSKNKTLYYYMVGVPVLFLCFFFLFPTVLLLSYSFIRFEGSVPTNELSIDSYVSLFTRTFYLQAILRTFYIGATVGALVVLIAYPISYWLARMSGRRKQVLTALALSPLLASVVVRTYGWWVVLNDNGTVNSWLLRLDIIDQAIRFLPSSFAITLGLVHALLPYGILTLMAAIGSVNPSLQRAANSLGASPARTIFEIVIPMTRSGILTTFLLTFALSISAYATPAILGGPRAQTIPPLIKTFMGALLDWSMGAALGVVLVVATLVLMLLSALVQPRKRAAA